MNDADYQRVPLAAIPETPVLPPYPMHCDSTGMPVVTMVENPAGNVPIKSDLLNAFPNPFNSSATITFDLPEAGEVKLAVYDVTGREVQDLGFGVWDLGPHSVVWEAKNCGSGVYFIRLEASKQSFIQKLFLLK